MKKYIDGVVTLPVKGFEEHYRVSESGKVYRYQKVKDIWKPVGTQGTKGYLEVRLSKYCKGESMQRVTTIHRLVAQAFIPNPEGLQMVDHIDEDKTNNDINNLRWCTHQQNVEYYNTKDGRDYYVELRAKHKNKVSNILKKVKEHRDYIEKVEIHLQAVKDQLAKDIEMFEKYKEREIEKIKTMNSNYKGYIDTSAKKYSNVEEMVKATGKAITVDGKEFISCGAAAQYIVDNTEGKNKATISKELRRYLQGKRSAWMMYDKFTIGY